ncbi:amidase [Ferrimicrobium acidiphilum]|uniref:amidase n=1 Tax=Ferrimicrobium acidiphilum TaxID=121039 RepID=UPI0023F1AD17|nr:amidase [Ferrimicrobium acidiphilum]
MIGEIEAYREGLLNVVVKDMLDVEGCPTTLGSRLVAATATPATQDSSVVARLRASGVHLRGKANLVEFAFGVHGINPWYGTPRNPLSGDLLPGGSSSGSAVAVALGEAEVGIGTDTGGSIRIPAACCGVIGLKPTYGLIDETGCAPLALSLDTIGVLARTLADLADGFCGIGGMLEGSVPSWIGQVRVGVPEFDDVVTEVLRGIDIPMHAATDIDLNELWRNGNTVLLVEAYRQLHDYLGEAHRLDPRGLSRLRGAETITDDVYLEALRYRDSARERAFRSLGMGEGIVALPTMAVQVPQLASFDLTYMNRLTLPFNYLGFPALALPVRVGPPALQGEGADGMVPFSLQLVAVDHRESQLLTVAKKIYERYGTYHADLGTTGVQH